MKIDIDFTAQELRWIDHAIWYYKNYAYMTWKNRVEVKKLFEKYDEWLDANDPDPWDEIDDELEAIRP